MKRAINTIILFFVIAIVTPVMAQTMDQRMALFNGMTEQQKRAGLFVVSDYLKARLKVQSI